MAGCAAGFRLSERMRVPCPSRAPKRGDRATTADAGHRRATADALFDRALDLEPGERAGYLERACAGDAGLRAEVEELLRLAGEPAPAFDPDAAASGPLWRGLASELAARGGGGTPSRAGAWRPVRELGRGGMGVVWLAERADGEFEQRAALKLLYPGVASEESLRRFERERQILAGLDHPGIARLLDGGRTADGQPYFVMELVDGRPIDRYCDELRLGIRERLALFVQVGRAVEHAHRNLVVHRDLKPSNIVVTGGGEVKLLDFGIAKLLQDEGPAEPLTRTAARILTPEYASPEQVVGGPLTVASDVYQLGLLLYELLSGRRAHRLTGGSVLEMARVVCHEEPRPPSAVPAAAAGGGEAAAGAEETARLRGTTPRGLARRLRGDLDTITLRALHKDPARRYPSVARLVEDVERHLAGRPVLARGDGLGYRAARFVRRHRLAVAAGALVVLVLAAYAATATVQARTIARERDRARAEAVKAEQVKSFVAGLFEVADPEESRGAEISARELLDRGWARIEDELSGQPDVQVDLLDTVGEIYRKLGLFDRAGPLLERALEGARGLGDGRDPLLTRTLRSNGRLRRQLGDFEGAEALLREALELQRARPGPDDAEVAETLGELGKTLQQAGEFAAAEEVLRRALDLRRAIFGAGHVVVADSLDDLGLALQSRGDSAAAEPLLREALELRRRALPADHPRLASSLSNLALAVHDRGRYEEAERLYREALAVMVEVWGEDHPNVAVTLNNLARSLRVRGELAGAEAALERALAIRRRTLGAAHPQVAMNLNDLGRLRYERGELDAAERFYREALAAYPAEHPWRSASLYNLGRVLEDRGDHPGAERLYRETLARQRTDYGEDHEVVGIDLTRIGVVRLLQGDAAGAEPPLREALEIFRRRLPGNHLRLAEALVPLGEALLASGRPGEAEPLLREALAIRRAGQGDRAEATREAARALGRTLAALGRDAEAAPLLAGGAD